MMKKLRVGFIGNFQRGYVGESADEVHLVREIEELGHTVYRIPRDEWREHVLHNEPYKNVPEDVTFDICLIAKWHHFDDSVFASKAREKYKCPVFLWVWDYMVGDDNKPIDWHIKIIQGSDLYLGNDVMMREAYLSAGIPSQKLYYFPMDVSDKMFDKIVGGLPKKYDVVFFGSYLGQGDRVEWLKKINEQVPIKVFSWNYEEWQKNGFDAEPAVYGSDMAQKVAESKIILGFNVNDHCWGYWSNRTGKILTLGGFLLYRWTPGMELFLRDGVEYFSSVEEAVAKIHYYLDNEEEREEIAKRGYQIGRDRFTSEARVKELMILIDRYLRTNVK